MMSNAALIVFASTVSAAPSRLVNQQDSATQAQAASMDFAYQSIDSVAIRCPAQRETVSTVFVLLAITTIPQQTNNALQTANVQRDSLVFLDSVKKAAKYKIITTAVTMKKTIVRVAMTAS